MFVNIMSVFFGGGVGAVLRYLFTLFSLSFFRSTMWGTLFVNVIGSCLLLYLHKKINFDNKTTELLLKTGFLGGLTTFSTFSFEFYQAMVQKKYLLGCGVMGLNIFFGVLVIVLIFR